MIKLVTLDLDDTLWDAGPVLARAEQTLYDWLRQHAPLIAGRYGIEELQEVRRRLARDRPELSHDFTRLRRTALSALLGEFGYDRSLTDTAVEVFLDARSQVSLYHDVDPALRELAREFRLVALTNGNTDLKRAGVDHYFEFSVSPADTGTSKPDPRMFAAVCARAGVSMDAIVHVGDEPLYDIEAAHRANVGSVWVNRRERPWPESYRRAQVEISSLAELRSAVRQIEMQRIQTRAQQ